MTTTNNGRVTVSRDAITFKGLIGSTTINRNNIKELTHCTGFMRYVRAVIRIICIVTIVEGIRLLFTHAMVEIVTYDSPKPQRIWFSSAEEYVQFCKAL
ncbi:MAG: hypothetical protein WC150_13305 [Bacteroidia bacterium]